MTDLRQEIDTLLDQINSHELRLSHGYAKLGALLLEAETSEKWRGWGFERFTLYLSHVGERISRQKSQVYAILQAATDLLPYMPVEKLEEIGITKAHELRRFMKQSGKRPDVEMDDPDEPLGSVQLLEYASRPRVTSANLRLYVNKLLHQEEAPQGYWYDLGGCYFTPEEKKTWERAVDLGAQMAEVGSDTSPHERLKQSLLLMSQEAIGTWEPQLVEASA